MKDLLIHQLIKEVQNSPQLMEVHRFRNTEAFFVGRLNQIDEKNKAYLFATIEVDGTIDGFEWIPRNTIDYVSIQSRYVQDLFHQNQKISQNEAYQTILKNLNFQELKFDDLSIATLTSTLAQKKRLVDLFFDTNEEMTGFIEEVDKVSLKLKNVIKNGLTDGVSFLPLDKISALRFETKELLFKELVYQVTYKS